MITPPPRAVLGNVLGTGASLARGAGALVCLAAGALAFAGCGDPTDPATVGPVIGVVRDAETDAALPGVTLTVAERESVSGADGRFTIDSVPLGTRQLTAALDGYVSQTISVEVRASDTEEISIELVPQVGPPGPSNVTATAVGDESGAVSVAWDPVDGATSYTVYWGTHPPVDTERGTPVPGAANPYIHEALSAGTTYYYVVIAHGPDGDTRPSEEVSATPDGPISIEFVNPTPTQIVNARFVVSVEISSVFQLLSVTAGVEDLTDELTYIPASDEWEGFFDVGDMPSPSYRIVHYTATDAMGNVARTAVLVQLDRLPVVTFSAPLDDAFAAPSIRVVATCTDDHPNGCEALIIQAVQGGGAITKVTATSSVDQTISLAEFDGQIVRLRAAGRDVVQARIPRVSQVLRNVFVDATPGLVEVASAGSGTLIDASATHLLAVEGGAFESQATDTLRRVDRASGQGTVLHDVPQVKAREGWLFPGGAIFRTQNASLASMVKEFRDGTVSDLASEVVFFKVKNPFAIWGEQSNGLVRRNLTTGTDLIVGGAGNTNDDVAVSGEVAFWTSDPYEIFLHDGSSAVQLTDDGDGDFANTYPVTDGIHVVYRRASVPPVQGTASIRLSDPAGDITLASNLSSPEPGRDYQVNAGWIAFVRPDAGSARQIWRRSTEGVESQVSAFGTSSTIETMGPGGEIVFTTDAVGSERRSRATPGGSPEDIGSGLGQSIYIDGQLHVMMGATLLRVE